jgi:hypothetical protein
MSDRVDVSKRGGPAQLCGKSQSRNDGDAADEAAQYWRTLETNGRSLRRIKNGGCEQNSFYVILRLQLSAKLSIFNQ